MNANWWSELYNDQLADMLLDRTSADEVDATVRFLVAALAIEPGSRVFDQCAGTGRLSIPLASWGADVVGVEQAPRYVERGLERAAAAGVSIELVAGDAFEFVPAKPCRAAFNWWTSFGYLRDDAANARMLQRAFDALEPGGKFALDYPNVPGLYARFRPSEINRSGDFMMLRESRLDLAAGLLHKVWTFITPDGRSVERPSTLRLYTPDRLAALLTQVGFTEVRVLGDVDSQPIALDSPRCIVIGHRPR